MAMTATSSSVEKSVIVNDFITAPINLLLRGSCEPNTENLAIYFSSDSTYNWDEIKKLFPPDDFRKDCKFSYEFCSECAKRLRPIWKASESNLRKLLSQNSSQILNHLKWTGHEKYITLFINGPNTTTKTLENVLLLTSIIEYSLGNIYYTVTKKAPPHLFRDLLQTKELIEIFGHFPIFFLQILLGTPNSVNIRNIAWHGFPTVEDIPSYYEAVLITVIMSLSRILNDSEFNIAFRELISNLKSYFHKLEISICHNSIEREIVSMNKINNSVIPKSHILIWTRIYELYRIEDYSRFILLLLPQLEFILRVMYGTLNEVDVSAKLDKYYIILDGILQETVYNKPVQRNQIFSYLNEGSLKLIYDIFISPHGPRIRDKISHGEVDLRTIDKEICSVLIYLSFSILFKDFQISDYESRYHMNTMLYGNIATAKINLENIKSIEIPANLQNEVHWNKSFNIVELISPLDETSFIKDQIKIFYRPAEENKVILLSMKIVNCVNMTCLNLIESFRELFALYEQNLLRSRRRDTLNKMLQTLPKTQIFLGDVLQIVKIIFFKLQQYGEEFLKENCVKILKFLKEVLKFVENLSNYSNKCNNDWERADMVHAKFRQTYEKYYKMFC